jgi:HPt (histidine-containing phosphotransfer) domain-containing protein
MPILAGIALAGPSPAAGPKSEVLVPSLAPTRPLDERLALIPGYSLSQGLVCLGGDFDRLVKVLRAFAATYRAGDTTLLDAVARTDLATVQKMAHSIQGACATVGAQAASELAEALGQAAGPRCNPESLHEASRRLNAALQQLSDAIVCELGQ